MTIQTAFLLGKNKLPSKSLEEASAHLKRMHLDTAFLVVDVSLFLQIYSCLGQKRLV